MLTRAVAFLFLLWCSPVLAESAELLKPDRLPAADLEGPQVLVAGSGKAKLFLASGRVFELGRFGLEEIEAPQFSHLVGQPFLAAASEGRWLLSGDHGSLVLIDGDEVSKLEAIGSVHSLAFWGGDPVAHFIWRRDLGPYRPRLAREPDAEEAPAFYVYNDRNGTWKANSVESLDDDSNPGQMAMFKASVLLAAGKKGKLWVANRYQYRVRRFSPSGRELLDLDIPKLAVSMDAKSLEQAETKLLEKLVVRGVDVSKITSIVATPGSPIVRALTAHEGRAYILWRGPDMAGNRAALDRISSVGEVERLEISLSGVRSIKSMAMDSDGLVLAGHKAEQGLYRISAERLEQAPWAAVTDIQGGLPPLEDAPSTTSSESALSSGPSKRSNLL